MMIPQDIGLGGYCMSYSALRVAFQRFDLALQSINLSTPTGTLSSMIILGFRARLRCFSPVVGSQVTLSVASPTCSQFETAG